ncbi:hypothetical protein RT41_GL000953 [Lactococcus fujiensis JCM 16395]|uniref:Uncharacterized protein n=1 Tax=Lactococcus fujiensis JCM 16395 TaxID=1291764 RepID=A0A2A5RML4_9LACT|nr:hypothetical protein RT41_GL000953 [Lactococcus fujiensis JCM 16395]
MLVYFGFIAFSFFWRYIMPILLLIFVIRLIISGILMLFNPYFWLLIGIIAVAIWVLNKFQRKQ